MFLSIVLQVNKLVFEPYMSLHEQTQRIDERSYLFLFLEQAGISCDTSSLGIISESCMGDTVAPGEVVSPHGRQLVLQLLIGQLKASFCGESTVHISPSQIS